MTQLVNYTILLVEDDELIGEMIRLNLEEEGYGISWEKDGGNVIPSVEGHVFDLIVLDIMLPKRDGFELAADIRARDISTPILMLTARSETSAKLHGLDLGADDYLTKPFEMSELLARVRALIRRSQGRRELHSSRIVSIGNCSVNLETREAETKEGVVMLSEKETDLIELFIHHAGTTLSRPDILDEVWGMDATPTERTVDNYIVRLRRLFEADPAKPRHLVTVRSHGYRFER